MDHEVGGSGVGLDEGKEEGAAKVSFELKNLQSMMVVPC